MKRVGGGKKGTEELAGQARILGHYPECLCPSPTQKGAEPLLGKFLSLQRVSLYLGFE